MLWLGSSRQIAKMINVIKTEKSNRWRRVFRALCLTLSLRGESAFPFCLEDVWFLVWLLQESRRITCKGVEKVQWAEGTRWHGSTRGGNLILLQSGNKTGQRPPVCHVIGPLDDEQPHRCVGPAADGSTQERGVLNAIISCVIEFTYWLKRNVRPHYCSIKRVLCHSKVLSIA